MPWKDDALRDGDLIGWKVSPEGEGLEEREKFDSIFGSPICLPRRGSLLHYCSFSLSLSSAF